MSAKDPLLETLISVVQSAVGPYATIQADSLLLGVIPEFDSSAIVAVLTMLEDQLGYIFDDEDLTAEQFQSVETLYQLLQTNNFNQ